MGWGGSRSVLGGERGIEEYPRHLAVGHLQTKFAPTKLGHHNGVRWISTGIRTHPIERHVDPALLQPRENRVLRQVLRQHMSRNKLEGSRIGIEMHAEELHVLVRIVPGDTGESALHVDLVPLGQNRRIYFLK